MSERVIWSAACLLALCVNAVDATAQSLEDLPAELERIQRPVQAARIAFNSAVEAWRLDSIARNTLTVAEVVGGMSIRRDTTAVVSAFSARATTVLREELENARSTYGPIADSILAGGSMFITKRATPWLSWSRRTGLVINEVELRIVLPTGDYFGLNRYGGVSHEELSSHLRGLFQRAVNDRLPALITQWSQQGPATVAWEPDDRAIAYRNLRIAGSPIGLACVEGNIPACRAALAIVPPGTDTLDLWYDSAQQRALATRWIGDTTVRVERAPLYVGCVVQGADSVCRAAFRQSRPMSPSAGFARAEFLRHALRVGGQGATVRLLRSNATSIEQLLIDVTGDRVDAAISAWHADVLQGRPPSPAPPAQSWAVGGLSAVLLLGFAVARGARS